MNNKSKILVIGDGCRDIFVYCDSERLCPDIPVPILNIVNQKENGGMAKNVQQNIMKHIKCDINTNYNWYDITKTRYVHDKTNHTFFRVDSSSNILEINIDELDMNYSMVVISDYNKGFLSEQNISYICEHHKNVFLDTKKILGGWANAAKYIKINNYEYNNSKQNIIRDKLESKIIRTMGGDGCEFQGKKYHVECSEVKDTCGAGDSFMAALCVRYLETENIEESIKFANKCASEVVKHRGVSTI
jgi:bifunctional ADP-heptose synthase (sugar kinase/adenylyltransferase)